MRRTRLYEKELRLEAERCVKYIGTARVRLEVLHFELNEPRELSRKNVERLKEVFRTDEIRRLEPRNHIPAVIDPSVLDGVIQASAISAESLPSNPDNDPPMLKFPESQRLNCLHGRHRIQAARETLPPTDAWWTVDLYLADTNPELRTTLIEEYSNEEKPSDGEIYCKIRLYERERNLCFKNRWKARLSKHGRRGLRQLDDHEELAEAFDDVLEIRGLWDGMRISTLHKLVAMKCPEPAIHYLKHIRKTFHKIFDKPLRVDKTALQKVDQVTVKAFELKAPRYSRRDARVLEGQVLSGQICSAFTRQEREAIWDELRSIDGLIPSLFTFFEDIKYLSACADCLKRLVKVSKRDTLFSALEHKFPYGNQRDDQYALEVAESTIVNKSGLVVDHFDLAYRQLWIRAMRRYQEMPMDPKKKKKDLLAKPRVERADEEALSELATLADRVGFESPEIHDLKKRSSDSEIARHALLKARKPDRYQYDETVLEANIAQILRLFMTATPLPREYSSPPLVSDNPDGAGNLCGFPDEDSQQHDTRFLFIPYLHNESDKQGEYVTSFFVRRSVYLAFFGKSVNLGIESSHAYPQSPETDRIERLRQQRLDCEELEEMEAEQQGQEILDQEKQNQEKQEQENLRQEELKEEQIEQERLGRERLQRERLEQERLEEEQLEEGHEQEQPEEEQFEDEWLEEWLEEERLEKERLEEERLEQLKQEQVKEERLEKERLEQERLKQELLDLKRIEETVEREELQEKLAQALKTQEKLEQEQQYQEEHDQQEQEKEDEERQRQKTRERGRKEQEKILKNSELARKRHTQIDMKSLEQDRLEYERLKQEQFKRERLKQERLEQEHLKRQRLKQEQLEQERLKEEKLERERLEREQLEQERLEREQLEQERLEREQLEREHLERERLEQERFEQQQLDLKRIEETVEREELQEKLAQALQTEGKIEREKQYREKQDMQEQERQEEEMRRQKTRKEERKKQEKMLKDSELTRKRHTKINIGSLASDNVTGSQRGPSTIDQELVRADPSLSPDRISQTPVNQTGERQRPTPPARERHHFIRITYKLLEQNVWRDTQSIEVDPSDPSEIERVAVKYMRKRIRLFDTKLNILTPAECFEVVTADESNTILLIPEDEININKELESSIHRLSSKGESSTGEGRKRIRPMRRKK